MNKLLNNFQKVLWPILLMGLAGWIAWSNYAPGTWLSGWDTLHSEFDFPLALERAWNGVWQGHQGLGSVASQAHMTDLVRVPIYWLLSLILPLSAVRYGFFFLTLLIGSWGMYFFLKSVVFQRSNKSRLFSFIGSVFYVLNPIVLQQYFVPLEMFAVHFATLPWLLLLANKYANKGSLKVLFTFGVVSMLASTMAHTATLFYAYLMALGLFLLGQVINNKSRLKRAMLVVVITLLVNSFWLLPNLYYLFNHSEEMSTSFINSTFSDEARLQNQSYGTLPDLVTMKNFLFNWQIYDFDSEKFVDLLGIWEEHYYSLGIVLGYYLLFAVSLYGLVQMIKKRKGLGVGLLGLFLLGAFFLLNENPPFGFVYRYLSENVSLFKEGFRLAFTKFSIIYLFALTGGFVFGLKELFEGERKLVVGGGMGLILAFMVWSQWPMFEGNLLSKTMKVDIPKEYFEIFKWFDSQEDGRVLKMPLASSYGWNYYDWGYQGAGFTWFGIKQPTLDREFDRWNFENEEAFIQIRNAYYGGDVPVFERLMDKYRIQYVLVDESVFQPGYKESYLRLGKLESILNKIGTKQVFSEGFLKVYEYDLKDIEDYKPVGILGDFAADDSVLEGYGHYFESENGDGVPFDSFDNRSHVNMYIRDGKLNVTQPIEYEIGSKVVVPDFSSYIWPLMVYGEILTDKTYKFSFLVDLPGLYSGETELVANNSLAGDLIVDSGGIKSDYLFIDKQEYPISDLDGSRKFIGYYPYRLGDGLLLRMANTNYMDGSGVHTLLGGQGFFEGFGSGLLQRKKISFSGPLSVVQSVSEMNNRVHDPGRKEAYNCDMHDNGKVDRKPKDSGWIYSAKNGGASCDYFNFNEISGFDDYLLWVVSKNVNGRSLKVYATSPGVPLVNNAFVSSNGGNIKILSPYSDYGYVVNIESRSFGMVSSENLLSGVGVFPFSSKWIKDLRVVSENVQDIGKRYLIVNGHSYENGWSTSLIGGGELDHVRVDGWQNGWLLPDDVEESEVKIIFWPQYLEWGGLVVLVLTLGGLGYLSWKDKKRS